MAWATPTSFTSGNTLTAAQMNVLGDDLLETAPAKVTTKGDIVAATGANAISRVAVSGTKGGALVEDSSATAGVKFQAPQCAVLRRESSQTITTATMTAITFGTGTGPGGATPEIVDTNSLHDLSTNPSRITVSVAGVYLLTGEIQFASDSTGYRVAQIRINNSAITEMRVPPATSSTTNLQLAIVYPLTASQYVEIFCYHTKGSDLAVSSAKLCAMLQYIT